MTKLNRFRRWIPIVTLCLSTTIHGQERFGVQVASYMVASEASEHVAQLKALGQSAYVIAKDVRGQTWFKVVAGGFVSREDAEELRRQLQVKAQEAFAVVVALDPSQKVVTQARDTKVRRPAAVPPPAPLAEAPVAAAPEPAAATPEAVPSAKSVAPASVPVPVPVPVPVKTIPVKGVDDVVFSLQVGAFPSEGEAKKRIESLGPASGDAFIEVAEVKGKTWHRLMVGRFETKKEAESYKAEYQDVLGAKGAFVKKLEKPTLDR
jgi:cell division protein FtsN